VPDKQNDEKGLALYLAYDLQDLFIEGHRPKDWGVKAQTLE